VGSCKPDFKKNNFYVENTRNGQRRLIHIKAKAVPGRREWKSFGRGGGRRGCKGGGKR